MGRKVLLAVTCWLAITTAFGEPEKNENISKDSVSEESAPSLLYHNIPNAVYASAVPYGSFSFNFPTFAAAPKTASSQLAPATVGYLKDSYGNKFVDTLQSAAYRTIPQQYVSLQSLPSHLTQPLVSAPAYQLKQGPQYYFGTQFRASNYQAAPPTVRYAGVSQPYAYTQNVAPTYTHGNTYSTPQGGHNTHHSGPSFPKVEANHQQYVKQAYPARQYENIQHATQSERVQQQAVPEKLTTTINTENGKQTVILTTRPSVPLLDLNLLEPLKFTNPLVPQIQQFLPRIHGATYQTLPQYTTNGGTRQQADNVSQKPKSFNNNHQYEEAPKRQPKTPPPARHNKPKTYNRIPEINSPVKTTVINSPNHKEIINEQIISYNKETTSDPVVYTYNMHSAEDPNEYQYTQKTVEPVKEINYSRGPKQVISHSYEQNTRPAPPPPRRPPPPQSSEASDEQSESSAESEEENSSEYQQDGENQGGPNRRPEHSREEYRYDKNQDEPPSVYHRPIQHQTPPQQTFKVVVHKPETELQPIRPDYDRDILQSNYKPNSSIKVDPIKHVRHHNPKNTYSTSRHPQQPQRPQSRPPAQNYRPQNYNEPVAHVQEKSKRIIIQEETPEEMHSHDEQMSGEMISQEENNEEDFEKAYKYAAYGFPAYESNEAADPEKDIYNPQSYVTSDGKSDDKNEYDPFQNYRLEDEAYPLSASPIYKDSLEKMKEEYALEYGINKPTSMLDRFKSKENYLKTYERYKPVEYFSVPISRKPKQKSKYTAASHMHYSPKPKSHDYNYSNEEPRDSSAFASRPNHKYKNKTFFVEPQFQYGFEPISIPRLLDSEIAAATHRNPESEKPAMRKKVYKENWYIKKTSTSGGNPSS